MNSSSFLADINACYGCALQSSAKLSPAADLEEVGVGHSLEKGPARWWTVRFYLCPVEWFLPVSAACNS